MIVAMESFGPLVRRLRQERGLSCADVGRRGGLTRGHLSLIERELAAPPRLPQLHRLAASLGVQPDALVLAAEQTRQRMRAEAERMRAAPMPDLDAPAAETEFGVYVRALRVARGLTQVTVGQAGGFDPGRMSDLEAGIMPPPRAPRVRHLARALGASPRQTALLLRLAARERQERGLCVSTRA